MSFTGIGSIVLLALTIAPAALATPVQTPTPVVDLGYATYQGYHDNTYDLNVFKGIRYAAPPVGKLRWQAPQAPPVNRKSIQPATKQPPFCPQSGGAKLPEVYGFNSALGNEDCLFLNVYAPPGAKDLPVLLWIHGGGYGLFGAVYDPSELISTNDNGFISVMIQYRLGAFGFLSSEGVHKHGKTNAGLLDMRFALEWVQEHIEKFGGDASRVTIAGESSGAGSVMLQSMAYGGREDHLFNNVIAASPYSTALHQYDGKVPTSHYEDFASRAGCRNGRHMSEAAVFACLVKADTDTLQYASANVSVSGEWGTWAFLPVVDGDFIQELPSKQLLQKKVSGKRVLSGNNANEGVPLSPPFVNSTADFLGYVHSAFPLFSRRDYSRLLDIYEFQDSSPENTGPRYDTLGDRGPTALNQSEMATGLQQTVFNIYAESSFDCPSYWLADAFAGGNAKESWKYQYSITPSYHGADLSAYFSVGTTTPTRGLIDAFQKIWGNFIINDTPVISITDAKGGADNATVPEGVHGDISWPKWNSRSPVLMNLNTTGGTTVYVEVTDSLSYWLQEGPGVTNEFSLADASKWEGGREKPSVRPYANEALRKAKAYTFAAARLEGKTFRYLLKEGDENKLKSSLGAVYYAVPEFSKDLNTSQPYLRWRLLDEIPREFKNKSEVIRAAHHHSLGEREPRLNGHEVLAILQQCFYQIGGWDQEGKLTGQIIGKARVFVEDPVGLNGYTFSSDEDAHPRKKKRQPKRAKIEKKLGDNTKKPEPKGKAEKRAKKNV